MKKRNKENRNSSKLMDLTELQEYLGLGKNMAMRVGELSGAKLQVSHRNYYLRHKIDCYLEQQAEATAKQTTK